MFGHKTFPWSFAKIQGHTLKVIWPSILQQLFPMTPQQGSGFPCQPSFFMLGYFSILRSWESCVYILLMVINIANIASIFFPKSKTYLSLDYLSTVCGVQYMLRAKGSIKDRWGI